MRLPDWFTMPVIDITPDPDVAAMLDQPAACDKHRLLVDAVAIEKAQRRIVERGGTVTVKA